MWHTLCLRHCNQSLIASSSAAILLRSSRGTTSCTPGSSSLSNAFCFASFAASSQEFSLLLSGSSGRPSSFNSQFSRYLRSRSRSLDGVARTWLLALRILADLVSFGRASPHQRKSRDSIFHPCSPTCHVLCLTGTAAAQPVVEIWSFWLDISVRLSVVADTASWLAGDGSIVHFVVNLCASITILHVRTSPVRK